MLDTLLAWISARYDALEAKYPTVANILGHGLVSIGMTLGLGILVLLALLIATGAGNPTIALAVGAVLPTGFYLGREVAQREIGDGHFSGWTFLQSEDGRRDFISGAVPGWALTLISLLF